MKQLVMQFFKFGIVGVICFIIDYGLMVFLTEAIGLKYLVSCGISFSVSVVVNYLLSMRYVFRSRDDLSRKKEFVIFIILSVIGLGITELLMWISVGWLGVHYMISKIVVTGIVLVYNFITRKVFIERQ